MTGEIDGYYEDFGEVTHLVKSLGHSYVYTGQYSRHRKKLFGVDPIENSYGQFVVFSQNHDQIGNRLQGDRLTAKLSFEALKLVAATVLLAPQVPLLFMGEEYGEKNPFQYFISHTDEQLVKMVQEGRKKEFSYLIGREMFRTRKTKILSNNVNCLGLILRPRVLYCCHITSTLFPFASNALQCGVEKGHTFGLSKLPVKKSSGWIGALGQIIF